MITRYKAEGYEPPKKKKSLIRRYISKALDNAANGLIRGTGNKPMYGNNDK